MNEEGKKGNDFESLDEDELLFEFLDMIDFGNVNESLLDEGIQEIGNVNSIDYIDNSTITSLESIDSQSTRSDSSDIVSSKKLCKSMDSITSTLDGVDFKKSKPKRSLSLKCDNYPRLFIDTLNLGDFEQFRSVTFSFLDPRCKFRIKKPTYIKTEIGPLAVIDYFETISKMCPDVVFLVRGMKKKLVKNGYALRCRMNLTGTIVDMDAFEKLTTSHLKEPRTSIDKPFTFADQMDKSKVSKADIDATRVAEVLIKEQNKLIQTFCKGVMYFFINSTTQKIDLFDLVASLSSIKAFEGDLEDLVNKIPDISVS